MTATPPPAPSAHRGRLTARRIRHGLIAALIRAGLVEYAPPDPTPPRPAAKAARIIAWTLTMALLFALAFAIAAHWQDRPRPAQPPANTINAMPAPTSTAPA